MASVEARQDQMLSGVEERPSLEICMLYEQKSPTIGLILLCLVCSLRHLVGYCEIQVAGVLRLIQQGFSYVLNADMSLMQ